MTDRAPSHFICLHCLGLKSVRNPSGHCDHLQWPDYLTDDAKRANGIGNSPDDPGPSKP